MCKNIEEICQNWLRLSSNSTYVKSNFSQACAVNNQTGKHFLAAPIFKNLVENVILHIMNKKKLYQSSMQRTTST